MMKKTEETFLSCWRHHSGKCAHGLLASSLLFVRRIDLKKFVYRYLSGLTRFLASVTTFRYEGVNNQFCFVALFSAVLFESHTLLICPLWGLIHSFVFNCFKPKREANLGFLNVGKWYKWRDNIEFPRVISAKRACIFLFSRNMVRVWKILAYRISR